MISVVMDSTSTLVIFAANFEIAGYCRGSIDIVKVLNGRGKELDNSLNGEMFAGLPKLLSVTIIRLRLSWF